jgi:hypothetical protein
MAILCLIDLMKNESRLTIGHKFSHFVNVVIVFVSSVAV